MLKRYADLVKRKPKDEELRREYSDLLSGNTANRSQAIEEYRKLVASDPSPETRYKFAKLLAEDRSHLDEAIAEYRKLLEAQPDNAQWREEYRKLLLWDGGHLAEAIKEQRRVVAANPNDFDAKRTLAQLVARSDPSSEEARIALRRPAPAPAQRHRAPARVRRPAVGRRDQPRGRDRRSTAPSSPAIRQPATRHKLARLLAGDPTHRDEAVEQYRTLIETDPGNPVWRDEYRQLLLSDERYRGDADRGIPAPRERAAGRPRGEAHARAAPRRRGPAAARRRSRSTLDLLKRQPANNAVRLEYADLLAG